MQSDTIGVISPTEPDHQLISQHGAGWLSPPPPKKKLLRFATTTDLSVLEVLLELLQHDGELLRLHPAVGQQHAAELPLRDPPVHWVVPLELEGGKENSGVKKVW